jgi:hypothetical protein
VDTLYPASGALSTFLLSGFIPSNCVPLSLTFYTITSGTLSDIGALHCHHCRNGTIGTNAEALD